MSWQYPKHVCGHDGDRYQAYGKMDNRERQLLAIERQECPACLKAKAVILADELGLPLLVGSDKQIAWASAIRERVLRLLPTEDAAKYRPEVSAKWWIDHRGLINNA